MKKIVLFLFLIPILAFSQFDKTIKLKVAMIQNCVKKDTLGETTFWQTKGKVTFGIVQYTQNQNVIFKNLFIKQYQELLPIYNKMIISEDSNDTDLFVKILILQEDDYRNLLKPEQLKAYSDKLLEFENSNPDQNDAYSSLFFSDKLLAEYKFRFSYKPKVIKPKTIKFSKKTKKVN